MYLICRQNERLLCRMMCRFMSSGGKKSYYEVLNLPRTCTEKEIKDAFIRMTKKLHPDRNKEVNSHEEFLRVMEAYQVLSKRHSRARYDVTPMYTEHMGWSARGGTQSYPDAAGSYGRKTGARTIYDDFYDYRDKSQFDASRPYYGVKGVKKKTNMTVVMLCLAIACIGLLLQLFVISASVRSGLRKAQEKSKRNAQHVNIMKEAALKNGNELQTQLLLKKITDGAQPAIATAALAETLADKPK